MHHIVTDGWSLGVAARELAALYEAFTRGPALAPARAADPVRRLRRLAAAAPPGRGARRARRLTGREQLDGVPPLDLPTDRPRPAVRSSRGGIRVFALSPELSAALARPQPREGATPFMTLLAAFQALLRRYSGQDDFAVGVAGRQPQPARDRGPDRLLREHARAPDRPRRRPDLPDAAGPGPRHGARGLRAPGAAVRQARRGAPAGPRPEPDAALPGRCSCSRTTGCPTRPGKS